jgi:arsenite methyltransferase
MDNEASIREQVRERYAQEAERVRQGAAKSGCCGGPKTTSCADPITSNLYQIGQTAGLPDDAVAASRGCGNPTALAELKPGEVVLDLGSGGGIDVLLAARSVGASGKAYGLDMTDEMLALARDNQRKAGVDNVEFLKGEIENIPLPDSSVDVIISNCVINLSGNKDRVLHEAFRVLRAGGRFAILDVVVNGAIPDEVRRHPELWSSCIAGALEESEYRAKLVAAGFEAVEVETTRRYSAAQTGEMFAQAGVDVERAGLDGKFMSAFIRARKSA